MRRLFSPIANSFFPSHDLAFRFFSGLLPLDYTILFTHVQPAFSYPLHQARLIAFRGVAGQPPPSSPPPPGSHTRAITARRIPQRAIPTVLKEQQRWGGGDDGGGGSGGDDDDERSKTALQDIPNA